MQLDEKKVMARNSARFTVVANNQELSVDRVDDNQWLVPRNVLDLVLVGRFREINSWRVAFPHLWEKMQGFRKTTEKKPENVFE